MIKETKSPNTKMEAIRKRTESVNTSMEWEEYLNLVEIAIETNVNNAIDLAWKLGYLAAQAELFDRIKSHFSEKGGVDR